MFINKKAIKIKNYSKLDLLMEMLLKD
jgi:hypothetical protein